ncbi:glycosyltransferase [Croceitalea sp. P059]|uniref:glycosyltransferase n=1 Tax=Croceitalea sp. P059 TaxID=3075601 RepID=UPI0028875BB4|nr:glycosyltransferase [Croceitalea sp. P059]MDT0540975.1 glycosyltransferase [Croceitalea sp. P059]
MKLLQINTVVNYGSTGRIAEQIGDLALEKGFKSYIAYGRKNGNSHSELIRIGTKFDNYTHVAKTRITDKHGLGSVGATKKFISIINEIEPDIIHLHNIHGYYLNYKLLFEYLNEIQIPIVWTLHDCWSFTGHCAYFDFVNCSKWISGCHSCPQLAAYPKSYVDNSKANFNLKSKLFAANKNLTLVPVSFWLKNLLTKSVLKNLQKKVIHNGVNLEKFKPYSDTTDIDRKFNIVNEHLILGVASVWEQRKGLQDFVKLNDLLKDRFKIMLVGLDKKQINSLPANIIGIERTESQEELAQIYSRADVFFNPTYEDNFPTTNLEAMACGTPVITYDTGGSPESITDETGFIITKGDLRLALEKIELLVNKNKIATTSKCRDNISSNYEMNKQFEKYFDLYEKILSKKVTRKKMGKKNII